MVTVLNKQRKIPIDVKEIQETAQRILDIIRYGEFALGILLTNNPGIRIYNGEYRHKDKPTDILSFAYHEGLVPGKRIRVRSEDDKNLGDLILSPEYIIKDALKRGVSMDERMRVLLVHGVCHLLGYDHEDDQEWRSMRAKEAFILRKLNAQ